MWQALSGLIAAEAIIYFSYFRREIVWNLPDFSDQAVLLSIAYGLVERMGLQGWPAVIDALASPIHPTGMLLPLLGAFAVALTDGARVAALGVNFALFVLLQTMIAHAVLHRTGSRAMAASAIGLVLTLGTTWQFAGGLFDFRTDFGAFCLYGCMAAAVLLSDRFTCWRWTLAAAGFAIALCLSRFVSVAYVLGAGGSFALLVAVTHRRWIQPAVFIAFIVAGIGPALWLYRHALAAYYGVLHLTGPEVPIRAIEAGLRTAYDHAIYYPHSIAVDHLGVVFGFGVYVLAGAAVISLGSSRSKRLPPIPWLDVAFLVLAVVMPLVAWNMNPTKAPTVGGVVTAPIILLLVLGFAALMSRPIAAVAAGLIVLNAAVFQIGHVIRLSPRVAPPAMGDLLAIADAATVINGVAVDRGWKSPSFSIDSVSPKLHAAALTAWSYEHGGTIVQWRPALGKDILPVSLEEASAAVRASDILVLTTAPKPQPYPFHDVMREISPVLRDYAQANMQLVAEKKLHEGTLSVFARRD